jgi:hypothetical protein
MKSAPVFPATPLTVITQLTQKSDEVKRRDTVSASRGGLRIPNALPCVNPRPVRLSAGANCFRLAKTQNY